MRILRFSRLLIVCLAVAAGQLRAEGVRISVPGGGVLVLSAPDGWHCTTRPGPVPTVLLTPARKDGFQVLVSPLVAPDGRLAPASPDALRHLVEGLANKAKAQSAEESLTLQSFGSGKVQGNYFSATDRAPKPGEFKYLTQGSLSVEGLPVGFSILSNDNPQALVESALRMLGAARRE